MKYKGTKFPTLTRIQFRSRIYKFRIDRLCFSPSHVLRPTHYNYDLTYLTMQPSICRLGRIASFATSDMSENHNRPGYGGSALDSTHLGTNRSWPHHLGIRSTCSPQTCHGFPIGCIEVLITYIRSYDDFKLLKTRWTTSNIYYKHLGTYRLAKHYASSTRRRFGGILEVANSVATR
jgi:hypothetical protein